MWDPTVHLQGGMQCNTWLTTHSNTTWQFKTGLENTASRWNCRGIGRQNVITWLGIWPGYWMNTLFLIINIMGSLMITYSLKSAPRLFISSQRPHWGTGSVFTQRQNVSFPELLIPCIAPILPWSSPIQILPSPGPCLVCEIWQDYSTGRCILDSRVLRPRCSHEMQLDFNAD